MKKITIVYKFPNALDSHPQEYVLKVPTGGLKWECWCDNKYGVRRVKEYGAYLNEDDNIGVTFTTRTDDGLRYYNSLTVPSEDKVGQIREHIPLQYIVEIRGNNGKPYDNIFTDRIDTFLYAIGLPQFVLEEDEANEKAKNRKEAHDAK